LKISFDKLELLPVGIVDDVGGLASILGCRLSFLPTWGLHLKQNQFGMALLKKMERWLVG
jgi:hypothetical protein